MAKSLTTMVNVAFKKLVGKAFTNPANSDAAEGIPSNIQLDNQSIFADVIPSVPSTPPSAFTAYDTDGNTTTDPSKAVVEYIEFDILPIEGSSYDGNTINLSNNSGEHDSGQVVGTHAYHVVFPSDYSSTSNIKLPAISTHGIAGITGSSVIQCVPPSFGAQYTLQLYKGAISTANEIGSTDGTDWQFDAFNGVIHVQDFVSSKVPQKARAYVYVGNFQKDKDVGDHTNSSTVAKQKLFNAYTFNQKATFVKASGSSFIGNDLGTDKGTYYFLNDNIIIGSEQVFANGLLQQSSSRGVAESSGEINDYLAYPSASNITLEADGGIAVPSGATIFEFTYPVSSSRLDGKVLVTYLAKDS